MSDVAWVKVEDAAAEIGVSRQAVHKRIAVKCVESWSYRHATYILQSEVDRWLGERSGAPGPAGEAIR